MTWPLFFLSIKSLHYREKLRGVDVYILCKECCQQVVSSFFNNNVFHARVGHPATRLKLQPTMLAQMRTARLHQEGRTLLAMQALRQNQYSSQRAAVRLYN